MVRSLSMHLLSYETGQPSIPWRCQNSPREGGGEDEDLRGSAASVAARHSACGMIVTDTKKAGGL
jgi:hypothetical protein